MQGSRDASEARHRTMEGRAWIGARTRPPCQSPLPTMASSSQTSPWTPTQKAPASGVRSEIAQAPATRRAESTQTVLRLHIPV